MGKGGRGVGDGYARPQTWPVQLGRKREMRTRAVVAPSGDEVVDAVARGVRSAAQVDAGPAPAARLLLRVGGAGCRHRGVVGHGTPRGVDEGDVDAVGVHRLVGGASGGQGVAADVLGGRRR